MNYLYSVLILMFGVLMNCVYAVSIKLGTNKNKSLAKLQKFNMCFTAVAAICGFIICLINGSVSIPCEGIIYSAVFGFLFSVTVFLTLISLDLGPLSLTNLIINFCLLLPLTYSFIALNEKLTETRFMGIALIFICMYLFSRPMVSEGNGKKASVKWLIISVSALVLNGCMNIVQKIYSMKSGNIYAEQFTAYGYLFAAVFSLGLYIGLKKFRLDSEKKAAASKKELLSEVGIITVTGTSDFFMNYAIVLLATRLDGSVVYPVIQGGGSVITALVSWLLLKEKMNSIKALAIVLGCFAIIILNI